MQQLASIYRIIVACHPQQFNIVIYNNIERLATASKLISNLIEDRSTHAELGSYAIYILCVSTIIFALQYYNIYYMHA